MFLVASNVIPLALMVRKKPLFWNPNLRGTDCKVVKLGSGSVQLADWTDQNNLGRIWRMGQRFHQRKDYWILGKRRVGNRLCRIYYNCSDGSARISVRSMETSCGILNVSPKQICKKHKRICQNKFGTLHQIRVTYNDPLVSWVLYYEYQSSE